MGGLPQSRAVSGVGVADVSETLTGGLTGRDGQVQPDTTGIRAKSIAHVAHCIVDHELGVAGDGELPEDASPCQNTGEDEYHGDLEND